MNNYSDLDRAELERRLAKAEKYLHDIAINTRPTPNYTPTYDQLAFKLDMIYNHFAWQYDDERKEQAHE